MNYEERISKAMIKVKESRERLSRNREKSHGPGGHMGSAWGGAQGSPSFMEGTGHKVFCREIQGQSLSAAGDRDSSVGTQAGVWRKASPPEGQAGDHFVSPGNETVGRALAVPGGGACREPGGQVPAQGPGRTEALRWGGRGSGRLGAGASEGQQWAPGDRDSRCGARWGLVWLGLATCPLAAGGQCRAGTRVELETLAPALDHKRHGDSAPVMRTDGRASGHRSSPSAGWAVRASSAPAGPWVGRS